MSARRARNSVVRLSCPVGSVSEEGLASIVSVSDWRWILAVCSVLNTLVTMYSRASPSDYDDWENVYGNKGWGSRDLIPLLKKVSSIPILALSHELIFSQMETYQVAPDKPTHGYDGPIKVSYGGYFTNVARDFLEVGRQYDTGRGSTDDPSDMININAYGVSTLTLPRS